MKNLFSSWDIWDLSSQIFFTRGTLSLPTSSRIRQHHGEYLRACLTYAELVSWQNLLILLFFYFIYFFFFYFFNISVNNFLCQNPYARVMSTGVPISIKVYFQNTCILATIWPNKFCELEHNFKFKLEVVLWDIKFPLSFHEGLMKDNGRWAKC